MKLRAILFEKDYPEGGYCTPYGGPYDQNNCEEVRLGILAANYKMQPGDSVQQWSYDLTSDVAIATGAKDGTLLFVDQENDLALYKLERLYVTRSNVKKVLEFLWNFEYQEQNGEAGYVTSGGDGEAVWFPAADLNNPDWATDFGLNPSFSILEALDSLVNGLVDAADKLFDIVPWWAWLLGSGYLTTEAYKEKDRTKQFLKGAGAAFMGFRAAKPAFDEKK